MNKFRYLILVLSSISIGLFAQDEAQGTFAYVGTTVSYTVDGLDQSVFNWDVVGGEIISDNNESVTIKWDCEPNENASLSVQEVSINECMGELIQAQVEILPMNIEFDELYEACEDAEMNIEPVIDYDNIEKLSYEWYRYDNEGNDSVFFGSDEILNFISNAAVFGLDNENILLFRAIDNERNCLNSSISKFVFHELPEAQFENEDSSMICNGTQWLRLNESYEFYEWSTGDILTQIEVGSPTKDTVYSVRVVDENGCEDETSLFIEFCNLNDILNGIPKVFNPTAENLSADPSVVNNRWVISEYISQFPNARVEVFDRWGRLVYSSDNPYGDEGWDGTYKGNLLPADSYYYIIDLGVDEVEPEAGAINIVY